MRGLNPQSSFRVEMLAPLCEQAYQETRACTHRAHYERRNQDIPFDIRWRLGKEVDRSFGHVDGVFLVSNKETHWC